MIAMPSSTAFSCVTSCRLAPVTTSDNGTPRPSTSKWRLLPFFSPIGRIRSDALLSHGRFHHRSINALPSPSDAFKFIIFGKAKLPQCLKDTRLLPFKKSGVNGAGTAVTLARQCLPLTPGAQHIDDPFKDQSRVFGFASTPDGHFKFPHLWPVKFPQAGRPNYLRQSRRFIA